METFEKYINFLLIYLTTLVSLWFRWHHNSRQSNDVIRFVVVTSVRFERIGSRRIVIVLRWKVIFGGFYWFEAKSTWWDVGGRPSPRGCYVGATWVLRGCYITPTDYTDRRFVGSWSLTTTAAETEVLIFLWPHRAGANRSIHDRCQNSTNLDLRR